MRRSPRWMSLFIVLSAAQVSWAEIPRSGPDSEKLANLERQAAENQKAFTTATEPLGNTPEDQQKGDKLFQEFDRRQAELYMSAVTLATANPNSEIGLAALDWVLTIPRSWYLPAGPLAIDLVRRQYSMSPKIGRMIAILAYYFPEEKGPFNESAMHLFNTVVEQNPDRAVRGQAALGFAWMAKHKFEYASWKSRPDSGQLAEAAVKAFEEIVRNYGDCANLRTMGAAAVTPTLAGEAEAELYELQHLQVGQMAPEIEGEDLAGIRMKLSDFHGKVVLLVFWASWCGPCMAAVPHEEELVEHFRGRPFVLIGVNGDGSKADAQKAVAEHKIPWVSFWNGTEGAGGPIAKAWNMRAWPGYYILDPQGVIRAKDLPPDGRNNPLERLVSAAESK